MNQENDEMRSEYDFFGLQSAGTDSESSGHRVNVE